jgi:Undecaprenyl-phosphate galactose phosphotransferase WbaP
MHLVDQAEAEIGFDALDGLDALQRGGRFKPISPVRHGRDFSRAALRSAPRTPFWWTVLSRNVRTAAPLLAADAVALSLAGLFAWVVLRLLGHPVFASSGWIAAVALLPLAGAYWLGGLYGNVGVHPVVELRQLFQVTTIALLAAAVGGMFASPPPLWCLIAWGAAVGLVPILRAVVRHTCAKCHWWGQPALIISSAARAEEIALTLLKTQASGLRPMALNTIDGSDADAPLPIVTDPHDMRFLVRSRAVRYAVIAMPDCSHEKLCKVVERYSSIVPHVLLLSDATALPMLGVSSRSCGALAGMEMRNARMLHSHRLAKRVLDLALGFAAASMAAPVLLVIALLVKLTSRGPVFFGHYRIGRDGRNFKAWKFRTMHVDGDRVLRDHLERNAAAREEWERDQKLRDDPRVTPLGKFLRKASLDELPQIWNVLRGEMSLVGPRPIVTSEVWRYGTRFKLYTAVRPGITGLWQVSGRNETTYDERVRFDEYYVRNWSPWLDVYILARTAPILIKSTGAY